MLLTPSKKRVLIAFDIVLVLVLCAVFAQPAYTYMAPQTFWAWCGVVLLTLMLTFGTTATTRILAFAVLYLYMESRNFQHYLITGVNPWSYRRINGVYGFSCNRPTLAEWPSVFKGLRFAQFNHETERLEPKAVPETFSNLCGFYIHKRDIGAFDQRLKKCGLYGDLAEI